MARQTLSPIEILEKLREIDLHVADGRPMAEALWLAGMLTSEYEKWRGEYAGLLRTLGPLAAPSRAGRKSRRSR
jgi:hypothetical protein